MGVVCVVVEVVRGVVLSSWCTAGGGVGGLVVVIGGGGIVVVGGVAGCAGVGRLRYVVGGGGDWVLLERALGVEVGGHLRSCAHLGLAGCGGGVVEIVGGSVAEVGVGVVGHVV